MRLHLVTLIDDHSEFTGYDCGVEGSVAMQTALLEVVGRLSQPL